MNATQSIRSSGFGALGAHFSTNFSAGFSPRDNQSLAICSGAVSHRGPRVVTGPLLMRKSRTHIREHMLMPERRTIRT